MADPDDVRQHDAPEDDDHEHRQAPKDPQNDEASQKKESIEPPSSSESSGHKPDSKPVGRWAWLRTKKGKIILAAASALVLVAAAVALPVTRYRLLGLFLRHDVQIVVMDTTTAKPVSNAQVLLGGKSALTNADGRAEFRKVPLGRYQAIAQKKYYNRAEQQLTIGIKRPGDFHLDLTANGRQVQLKVINKLTKKPLAKTYITVRDTNATTDDKGEATIVVPAEKLTENVKITKEGFHDLNGEVQVVEQVDARNTLAMVPNGTLTYLSKRTGHINVMRANLDGSEAKVILEGTGLEDDQDTVLLAARDWRFAVLKAKREGDFPKLYLINVATSAVSTIDEGDALFTPVGWYNEYFVYQVRRNGVKEWQSKQHALKSFNANTGQLTTLDESAGEGSEASYYSESITKPYILDNLISYSKVWSGNNRMAGKRSAIMTVKPNGQDKKVVKDFDAPSTNNIDARLYKPQEIYFVVYDAAAKPTFYEFENGTLQPTTETNEGRFYSDKYPTYLLSPSGKKTLWYESRDGHNVVFTGSADAQQAKEVNSTDEFVAYGWYTEDYLLLSKKSSELYIVPFDAAGVAPFKITDYHKPAANFSGYGYGYGGF